jgi:hypothetical protein
LTESRLFAASSQALRQRLISLSRQHLLHFFSKGHLSGRAALLFEPRQEMLGLNPVLDCGLLVNV